MYLCHFQGAHYSCKTEHVPHGALQLSSQLDGFVEQGCPLLRAACAAQNVHSDHDGHGVKPAKGQDTERGQHREGGCYGGLDRAPPLPSPVPGWEHPGELGQAMEGSLVGSLWPCCAVPFQQVQAELVAVGKGEQLHARAHPHEPLHLRCHTQYPGDLARKGKAD